jgi:hypothetical protein
MRGRKSKRFRDLLRQNPRGLYPRISPSAYKELRSNGRQIGKARETFAYEALTKESSKLPSWIKWVSYATHKEDKRGVDLVVGTDVGKISVQIKGTRQAAIEFKERHRNSNIQVVIVKLDRSIEEIRQDLLSAIENERKRILEFQSA